MSRPRSAGIAMVYGFSWLHADEVVCLSCSFLPSQVSHTQQVCGDNGSLEFLRKGASFKGNLFALAFFFSLC